nr:hypothetical protein TetV2_00087 [Oceanusvirus sp.]
MPSVVHIERNRFSPSGRERKPFTVLHLESEWFPLCVDCEVIDDANFQHPRFGKCVTCFRSKSSHFTDLRKAVLSNAIRDILYEKYKRERDMPEGTRFLRTSVHSDVWDSRQAVCSSCEYQGIVNRDGVVYTALRCDSDH